MGSRTKKTGWLLNTQSLFPSAVLNFDGPAVEVSDGIRRSSFGAYGRDSSQKLCLLANAGEEVCIGDVGDVVRNFEVTACPSSFGMDHSFRDSLPQKMG